MRTQRFASTAELIAENTFQLSNMLNTIHTLLTNKNVKFTIQDGQLDYALRAIENTGNNSLCTTYIHFHAICGYTYCMRQ